MSDSEKSKKYRRQAAAQGLIPAAALAVLLSASEAFAAAAEGAHHHASITDLLYPIINFCLFAAILFWIHKKATGPLLVDRSLAFAERLKKSTDLLEQAERELDATRARLDDLEKEKADLRARLTQDGKNMAESVAQGAERTAEKLLQDTERRIASDLASAQAAIREAVVARASQISRERLRSELAADDDLRLRKEAIRSLG